MVYFLWVSIFSSWHISSSCLTSCALFLLLKPLTFNSSFNPFTVIWEKSVYFLVDLEGDSHFKFHLIVADLPDLNFLLLFSSVFSNFNIPVAFFALCVTVYSQVMFFKLPLTLLLSRNIPSRVPLLWLLQTYCMSYIIVLVNPLPCKYFDWFVELKKFGMCATIMCVNRVTGLLIHFSFAIYSDKPNPLFGLSEKICGVFLIVPVMDNCVNFSRLYPYLNHGWYCFWAENAV